MSRATWQCKEREVFVDPSGSVQYMEQAYCGVDCWGGYSWMGRVGMNRPC